MTKEKEEIKAINFDSNLFSGLTSKITLTACYNNLKQFSKKEINSELAEAKAVVRRYDRLKKMPRIGLDEYFYNQDKVVICNFLLAK